MLSHCPVCGSANIRPYLKEVNIPVFQNMIYHNFLDALNCSKGIIDMCVCEECGFRFNRCFEVEKVIYTSDYDNRQDTSPKFQEHLNNILDFLEKYCSVDTMTGGEYFGDKKNIQHHFPNSSLEGKTILEPGCGQGYFLNKIAQNVPCHCIGYDPSYKDNGENLQGDITFVRTYFTQKEVSAMEEKADIVIFRHVIEHLENPLSMLHLLYQALKEDGYLYVETPAYQWILENHIVFDHSYEHCSYFTDDFMYQLLEKAGFEVVKLYHSFEGQYLSVIAKKIEKEQQKKTASFSDSDIKGRIDDSIFHKIIGHFQKYLSIQAKNQKVCLWGAGGKGTMCANLFDPQRLYLEGIIDIYEKKQNNYIPGTGHIIFSPDRLKKQDIGLVIVMNNNYLEEIIQMVQDICKTTKVIGIEDFFKNPEKFCND